MKFICKYLLLFLFYLTQVHCIVAQNVSLSPSAKSEKKIKLLEVLYDETIENNAHLYNGIEYIPYSRNTEGHPYYSTEAPITGSITYSNQTYKRVSLQYDLLYDKVIVEHPIYSSSVQLIDKNIKDFSLGDRNFIHLLTDSTKANVSSGFYELLYNGKSQCLAKRRKTIIQRVKNGELQVTFHERSRLFILKNEKYFLINSKRDLKNIFQNKSISVSQFIRKNKLSFIQDKENSMVKVAAFFDEQR